VATSVAAVAVATIASQKFFNEGPIHNDAYPSNLKTNAKGLRVGGRDWDEDELRLLVWGSNRYVYICALRVDLCFLSCALKTDGAHIE
jgi:hypothetical protein